MKIIFSLIIMMTLLASILSGCSFSESEKEVQDLKNSESSTAEDKEIPDEIIKIFDSYKKWETDNKENSSITFSKFVRDDGSFFEFSVQTIPADFGNDIRFYKPENGAFQLSFHASFPTDYDMKALRDFITATICVTAPSYTYDSAKSEMESMIESFDGNNISDVFWGDNYAVYLSSSQIVNGYEVNAVYLDESNQPVNQDEYESISYESAKSPINEGRMIYFEGTVQQIEIESDEVYITLTDSSQNEYLCLCSYADFLDRLIEGDICNIYGEIRPSADETVRISVHHFVKQ